MRKATKESAKKSTNGKRGRRTNASKLPRVPSMDAALIEYNAFQEALDKQLPRGLRDTVAMYNYRRDRYDAARREGLSSDAAIGRANKETAGRFNCSTPTVLNNIGTIRPSGKHDGRGHLARNGEILAKLQREFLFPRMELCNQDARRLNAALKLLRDPSYADLKPESSIAFPKAALYPGMSDPYSAFRSAEAAQPDSPQRLASVLAEVLSREHQARIKAERWAQKSEADAQKVEAENGTLRQTVEHLNRQVGALTEKLKECRAELANRVQKYVTLERRNEALAKAIKQKKISAAR